MNRWSPARTRVLAVVWIALANVLGGVSYPMQKAALEGLPPATVTFVRNGVAALALYFWVRARGGERVPWERPDRLRALTLGSVAYALPMWLGIIGVQRAGASNASILILLEPITIVVIAVLFQGERVGPLKLTSLALGLVGALAIVLEGADVDGFLVGDKFIGHSILVLHGVLWGCYTPIAKPLTERHDPFELCLRVMLVATALLFLPALRELAGGAQGPAIFPALAWSVALGLFVSLGSTVLWLAALRHIPATNVAGFVFLQPLAGVLIGTGLLGEALSRAVLIGGALIVAGVGLDAVLSMRGRPRSGSHPPAQGP